MLKFPGLSKINNLLLFSILISVILYFGREFFILVTFAGLFAMLMRPLSNKLEKRGIPRFLSSLISIVIIIVAISAIIMLLSAQVNNFVRDFPQIKSQFGEVTAKVNSWIIDHFDVNFNLQANNLRADASQLITNVTSVLTGMVKRTFTFVGSLFVVVILAFLFLQNRSKFKLFIIKLQKPDKMEETADIIETISQITYHYLGGRLLVVFIIAVLLTTGFLITGLKNAVFIGIIAALVAIIPYVGPLLGGLIPLLMSIVEGSLNQVIEVVAIVLLVNTIDHYFLEPYIVGGSVNINPFFTILSIIIGGVFWGIAGVILFLPLLAILKIIFESIEGLEPYAYLIGDNNKIYGGHVSLYSKIRSYLLCKGIIRSERRKDKGKAD